MERGRHEELLKLGGSTQRCGRNSKRVRLKNNSHLVWRASLKRFLNESLIDVINQ